MSMQDLMSDFVARIKNGVIANNKEVTVLKNKLVVDVCKKMTKLGYFEGFQESDRELVVTLADDKINEIKRFSKPGQRQYFGYQDFPKMVGGIGFSIFTTSQGVKTHMECLKEKTGGELLFQVY